MARTPIARMAWRNLWRNRRRTLLTLASIAFGLFLAVVMTGLQEGSFAAMVDMAARLGAGHVTLQDPAAIDSPGPALTVHHSADLRARARREPHVARAVERISGQVMLSTPGQTYGALFIAYDPTREDDTTLSLLDSLDKGAAFASTDDGGIVLGRKLAENLGAGLGRKVVYTLTDKHGDLTRGLAHVSGILDTGTPSLDAAIALFPIDRMRRVLGYGADESGQVAVFVDDQRRAASVARDLTGDGVAALPWFEMNADLASFIAMKIVGARIMLTIIVLLIGAGIFNTIFVSVMERVSEFGVLLAIGFSPGRLFGMVMFESLFLGLVGVAAGALITAGPYWYLSSVGVDIGKLVDASQAEVGGVSLAMNVMHARIFPESLAVIVGVTVAATLLSGLWPAWKAGRVDPVESIRLV
jgi:ABC-type lipoprotein release transport system permease subunit